MIKGYGFKAIALYHCNIKCFLVFLSKLSYALFLR